MAIKLTEKIALPLFLVWSEKKQDFVIVAAESTKKAKQAVR